MAVMTLYLIRHAHAGESQPESPNDHLRPITRKGQGQADTLARAVERYASRYRQPRENPTRVALRIEVDRFVFGPGLLRAPTAT